MHEPMPSGDGLLIRIKPFGGRLSAGMLCAIADVASGCGNGIVELTSRGNVQLRGLSDASVAIASAALIAAGLADADATRERRRNVIAVPPCDDALVARIEAILVDIENLAAKFCVAVGDADADIMVSDGFVSAGGSRIACLEHDVPKIVDRLARAAGGRRIASGCTASRSGMGSQGGSAAVTRAGDSGTLLNGAMTARSRAGRGVEPAHNEMKWRGDLLYLPYGQTNASALRGLAPLIGSTEIRTTPWRAFHFAGQLEPSTRAALGFISDHADPRRFIAACPGAPACASASVATRADADFLASLGVRGIHVSGCSKGCAHHRPATTLIGANGRYNLVRHGLAGATPDATGLTIAEAAAAIG